LLPCLQLEGLALLLLLLLHHHCCYCQDGLPPAVVALVACRPRGSRH
jgi:hypothetical protein